MKLTLKVWRPILAHWGKRGVLLAAVLSIALLAGGGAVLAQLGGAPRLSSSSDIALNKGLIGWWKLDGNAKDSTPFGRDGTMANTTPSADREGKANGAYSFNGSTSDITVSNMDSTVMTSANYSASWTLSIWAAGSTGQGAEKVLLGKHGCNGGIMTDGSNSYRFQLFDASCSTNTHISATPADITKWHLLTATYTNGSMQFYMDGQSQGTASTATMNAYNNVLGIGASDGSPTWQFNGSLDDARVYNRAISAAEVMAIYKSYNDPLDAAQGENGLVGWWKFDGNAKDASPYGDDGTVNGASLTADRKARANSAYSFNGTTDYISVPDSSQLDNGSMTASLWLNLSGTLDCDGNNNWRSLISKGSQSATTTGWDAVVEENMGVQFDVGYGGVTHRSGGVNVGLSPGTPTLLTFTYDAATGTRNIYANGVLKNTATLGANAISSNAQPLNISKGTNTASCPAGPGYVPGTYDDVRLYNRALSQSEIQNLYNSYDSVVALGGSNGSVQLGKGLVGDWPMNGNAKDNTPYGDNGTVTAATLTTDRKGRANSAYSFNGTSNGIYIPNAQQINSENLTLSVWVKTTQTATSAIVEKWGESGIFGPYAGVMRLDSAFHAWFGAYDGTHNPNVESTSAINDGVWHHLVGTRVKGGSLTLYVDGLLQGSTADTTVGSTTNASGLGIGYRPNNTLYFSGSIDDVQFWNRALNQAEITALYNEYR